MFTLRTYACFFVLPGLGSRVRLMLWFVFMWPRYFWALERLRLTIGSVHLGCAEKQ